MSTIEKRVEKLENEPEYRQDLLLVTENEDGTYSDMFGRKYSRDELKACGSRVLIWQPHKPKEGNR